MAGRPSVMTAETVRKLAEALTSGKTVKMACFLAGISRDTYYSHIRNDQAFSDKMEVAQAWVEETARENIAREIENGNVQISKWYLERKARAEFGAKLDSKIEVESNEPKQHMIPVPSTEEAIMSLEELIDLRERLKESVAGDRATAGDPSKILNNI